MKGRILVTGARSPAALDVARDLAGEGIEVHMADSVPARISRWSKAPAAVHRLRPPVQDPKGFRDDVADLVARLSPMLVVPTCEEVFHLAAAKAEGVDVGPLFAPDAETLDVLHAKDRFNDLARGLGLAAPETVVHRSAIDPDDLDLPKTVVKACYSRFGAGTLVAPDAARVRLVRPSAARPWISQRRVDGVEHSSYAIAVGGRVTGFAAYRSTARMAGGAGYAFRRADIHVAERMLAASWTLADALSLTGQISLDAIDDGSRSWLIECNPRATSGAHLLSGTGAIARAVTGKDMAIPCPPGQRHNLPMMLTHGLPALIRSRSALKAGRDVVGAPGDRLPLLGAMVDTFGFAIRAARFRTTMTGATTADIEWNGTR